MLTTKANKMPSVEVEKRLNELRLQKQHEAEMNERSKKLAEEAAKALIIQQTNERKDAMINCEAEAILFLETLTDAKIISEFTVDKEPDSYIAMLCATEKYGRDCPMNIPYKKDCHYCQRVNKEIELNLCIIQNGNPCYKHDYVEYKTTHLKTYGNTSKLLTLHEYDLQHDVKIFKTKYIWKYVMNLIEQKHQKHLLIRKERGV